MAKKTLAAFVTKKKKAEKTETATKSNPPPMTDIVEFVVPGFAGYAGTRFTSRAIHTIVAKRWPGLAKHGSVLSTFAAAGLAYLLVHRVKRISQYHTPVVVGAGIAALQTAVQAYVPKYGWLVSDHELNAPTPQTKGSAPIATSGVSLPPPLFASNWKAPKATQPAPQPPSDTDDDLGDLDLGSLGDADGDGFDDDDIDDLLVN